MNVTKSIWRLRAVATLGLVCLAAGSAYADCQWIVFEGEDGPGNGKHIVLIAADDEYRSEDSIPQLAKILAERQGFKCTVLFAINPDTGEIDPSTLDNIPGLEVLEEADMMVIFARFRELPDEQMKYIDEFVNSGGPVLGLRTATHAFNYKKNKGSPYAKYSFRNKEFDGGFGRQILGETWINHYGHHKVESTRGRIVKGMEDHPIVRGVEDIWGESDVYGLTTLSGDSKPIVMGEVLTGMNPSDPPNTEKPPVAVAWTKTYTGSQGKPARVFNTTMGHSFDFFSEGFRRLVVNGCFWCLGMEEAIPAKANVDFVGEYDPNQIGMGGHKVGLKPCDHLEE